uniref:Phorbol-ester/DAG-type domain-containing protein n=1 Tax=Mesocestoides corti TaxID=53468 RepID=A0A5K3EZ07_MESCO
MGTGDRLPSNYQRRPVSLADSSQTSPYSGSSNSSIFRTLPSVKKNRRKVHSPTSQVKEEDPSLSTKFESVSSSGRLRGQSEGLEQSKRLSDCINAAPVACVPQIPPPGHYLGRSLNEDSDDDEIREEISAIAARFRSAANVLSSPSLCGVLLNYLLIQNRDLSPTLFYLVAKHYYWVQTHVKDLAKDFMRLLVEIYTTFLHEKSPLPVKVDSWIIQQMENSVLTKETATVFEGCCAAVLPQIQAQVDKLNKDILLGIDTWKPSENFDLTSVISREEELGIFESIISPRVNELQRIIAGLAPLQSPQQNPNQFSVSFNAPTASTVVTWLSSTSNATDLPKDQIAAALCYSLVSAYRYFAAGCSPSQPETPADDIGLGSVPICPSTPAPPQHSFKRTLFAKSIENLSAASTQSAGGSGLGSSTLSGSMSNSLATLGVINWEKLPTFNAKLKSKSSSVIFGSWKTRHSQKGHSLQDRIFDRTAECVVCGGLLWGLAPQGLACQGCDINVHYKCKSGLKEPCTKDTKSSSISRGSITNLAMSSSVGSPSGPLPASRSGTLSSPISPSQYPSPPEPACGSGPRVYCSWNVRKRKAQHRPSLSAMLTMESIVAASQHKAKHQSAGNFTSPLENNGNNFGESGDDGFSGLVASTEDIFHCQTCGLNEFLGDGSSDCPLQSTPFSPETTTSSSAIADDVKVKRSNSGFSHAQSTSLIRGSSHAGITSPEPISPLSDLSKAHIALIRSSSQVLRKTGSSRRSFFSSTLNLSGYVRNVKQKLDNHSSSAAAAALSKHTASLMQLPLMADRDLKRPSAPHAISSSASVSAAANVPELVPTWSGDPEMNALETFEAATELRIHFPNYEIPTKGPRVEDHVRTLVLLEFHQKVRYMVCYLKQFDYLLLQCWPKEHQRLADIMALDRIPRLIRLFRSLVHTIEGTLEPQGYGKMAEAVLAWLSEDDEANLKAWLRDCQALSCTNMLDSVKATVREYGRKHPDIQPLLETRFNKFVLIEGLSQVRVLYFNLPLISNNIMKDLEKKTSSYKNEAKLWKEIHTKLASIPHSIDKICMPLVKLINDGHFFSTVDKGEQLTRHQAQGGNVPFADILLEFPRTIFRYWVIDYAEIAVDKLTFTSDNRVNYDYVKERTDVLAILLNCALVLLVKDGGRYGLRPFKPSKEASVENANAGVSATSLGTTQSTPNMLGNTMKLSPVFSTDSVFTSRGEKIGHEYMLNMIFKEQAVLLRLSFSSKETREKWLNIIKEREEFSNQRRLAMQKTRSSLPPVSMHSSGDSKGETKSLKAIRGFTESPEPKIDINCVSQTVEPDMSANNSSPEALERQITHFTDKISEMEKGLQGFIQSFSDVESFDANEVLEKLSLKPGESLPQSHKELITAELLLTEMWLRFINKQLLHLSKYPTPNKEENVKTTVVTNKKTAESEKGHQRSKSAFVIPAIGPADRRRRSRTRSGSNYQDCIEQVLAKSPLTSKTEIDPAEGKGESGLDEKKHEEGSTELTQLEEMLHDLQNLIGAMSVTASRALSDLGSLIVQDKPSIESITSETPEPSDESKSDDDQPDAFVDANSSLSSSAETDEPRTKTFEKVQESEPEQALPSDYEEELEEVGSPANQLLEDFNKSTVEKENHPTSMKEPISKLDEELLISNSPILENQGNNNEICDEELRAFALELVDDAIDSAGAYENDLALLATDITDSAVASAIAQVMESRHRSGEFGGATDSGISFIDASCHFSSGEDDEMTVTGSKPHLCPSATQGGDPEPHSTLICSDLDKLDTVRPLSHPSVSVGRNDSQRSTTSSGYLGSGDEIIQHDWI